MPTPLTIPFADITRHDVALVGGKNASLGEMIGALGSAGIRVPGGFAVTAEAYRQFVAHNSLAPVIRAALAQRSDGVALRVVGDTIRTAFLSAIMPPALDAAIRAAYHAMSPEGTAVAVRSSATAEDLPEASFAGQQESYLNVLGADAVVLAVQRCFASLFTDRAITYRDHHGFDHLTVYLSVGVQYMVRSDVGASGVVFTLDTETGFRNALVVNGSWGLGEMVVKGLVTPDEWRIFKPTLASAAQLPVLRRSLGTKARTMIVSPAGAPQIVETAAQDCARYVLTDDALHELCTWCVRIESHYGIPMDIEWAWDGVQQQLFIVQARPETVRTRDDATVTTCVLRERAEPLVRGVAVGQRIAAGPVCVLQSMQEADRFVDGAVLVAPMTDPDWVPLMKRAAAIVTDTGGRTSHAAIVSRELGVAAIVGAGNATTQLASQPTVTVSCAEGPEGRVYAGTLAWDETAVDLTHLPTISTRLMLNVADPDVAMRWWQLPVQGVGLARLEFIIEHMVGAHPMAFAHPERCDDVTRSMLATRTSGYASPADYFVSRMGEGIASIAASQWPHPVIVRFSDFKTNEYAHLAGGRVFEPVEENPMLGFRGASRYYSDQYRDGFALECRAVRMVREQFGFSNIVVMIPFCRTPEEADAVLAEMAQHGLERGREGLQVYVMAEIPSNVILADEFAKRFDGFSIGSNDLTQLILGVDRDNAVLAAVFDERHAAVRQSIAQLIRDAHAAGKPVGICGQAPSDHPEFATWLVREQIDSISLNPDSVVSTLLALAKDTNAR